MRTVTKFWTKDLYVQIINYNDIGSCGVNVNEICKKIMFCLMYRTNVLIVSNIQAIGQIIKIPMVTF